MLPARKLPDAVPAINGPISRTTHPKPSASTTTAAPAAVAGLPRIKVERRLLCHWAKCSKPAEVRITFTPPSLLSSEPDRNYCAGHAETVSSHQGAVMVGRFHLAKAKCSRRKPA